MRGAKKGNKNAQKDAFPRAARAIIQMTADEKDEITAAARKAGLSFSSFIRLVALKAARGEIITR
ncbi:MAG: hypothetical protein LBU73_06290 [Helicobacteraceae bacterium]|jgi:uncharacterized protein (DUF1778 family)|nr:hypothetical protein [Helicobacteraceae bacterium]